MTRVRLLAVSLVLALATAWPGPAAAGEPRKRVAVLEFRGRAVDEQVRAVFADSARAGALDALRGRPFLVMTRESMAAILKDMGKSSTCEEGECEVETARNIGADLVITGDVVSIEGTYIATLKLHETSAGSLLGSQQLRGAQQLALLEEIQKATASMLRTGLELGAVSAVPPAALPPPAVALRVPAPPPVAPSRSPEAEAASAAAVAAYKVEVCTDPGVATSFWFCDRQGRITENEFIRRYAALTGSTELNDAATNRAPRVLGIAGGALMLGGLGVMGYGYLAKRPDIDLPVFFGGVALGGLGVPFIVLQNPDGDPTDHTFTLDEARRHAARYDAALRRRSGGGSSASARSEPPAVALAPWVGSSSAGLSLAF